MYERMLTKYYDEIFRYCYHHVGSREMAEDLCQDTFLCFLEHRFDYQSRGKLKSIENQPSIEATTEAIKKALGI